MDHRWDEALERERAARAERERYGDPTIDDDPDVTRRDRARDLERAQRPQSPWEIGAAHWDQRDLYTRNARIDDEGYGRGPRLHPPEGSYAYRRDPQPHEDDAEDFARHYRREAWPIERYEVQAAPSARPENTWRRLRRRFVDAIGLGPKGFQRSDARLLEDVCDALSARWDVDATDIEVTVETAEVTLKGTVPDREMKRTAEDVAASCAGVRDVHNRLRVEDESAPLFGAPVRAY